VNHGVLVSVSPAQVEVEIWRADELEVRRGLSSELDEMWSYVARKSNLRWLWHAIDHHTEKVLAYVFGRRKDNVFLRLQQLLEPFGITKFYTDGWGAYERHIEAEQHQVGKENTQKIESKHINLRTRIKRLVRRTICFSKTEQMHDLVIGLFINLAFPSETASTALKHLLVMDSSVPRWVARFQAAWRKYMAVTIRLASTIVFIDL
jgi:insertion element IS1 protein InsB